MNTVPRIALLVSALLVFTGCAASPPVIQRRSYDAPDSGVQVGIELQAYPYFELVPGTPVYYAPHLPANYFFYDGYYWVYHADHWHYSDWYNGPWLRVAPDDVPLFVLRVPVRYYLAPPAYFRVWIVDAPPRWHQHWGPRWTHHHPGWDRWDRYAAPPPAPLPLYQRHYAGDRYPRGEHRHVIQREHYAYRPRETNLRPPQQVVQQALSPAPVWSRPQEAAHRDPPRGLPGHVGGNEVRRPQAMTTVTPLPQLPGIPQPDLRPPTPLSAIQPPPLQARPPAAGERRRDRPDTQARREPSEKSSAPQRHGEEARGQGGRDRDRRGERRDDPGAQPRGERQSGAGRGRP